jgi:hypothetical protein
MVTAGPERGRAGIVAHPYPEPIVQFLRDYHAEGVTEADCRACSSPCCSLGGFAILENVVQIYAVYRSGGLRRTDYEFEPGISFADFVFKYFDVYKKTVKLEGREAVLMLFHMKSLSADSHLISIPAAGDYWETRTQLFEQNPWLNRGCVFLSQKVQNWPHDDGEASRRCILHAPNSDTTVTTKPIDCVFFTCNRPIEARVPTTEQSEKWFQLLAEHFPNSLERLEALIHKDTPEE